MSLFTNLLFGFHKFYSYEVQMNHKGQELHLDCLKSMKRTKHIDMRG